MKVYKCDVCGRKTEYETEINNYDKKYPSGWITMSLNLYHNDKKNGVQKLIHAGKTNESHFCSELCFVSYFFKIENFKVIIK